MEVDEDCIIYGCLPYFKKRPFKFLKGRFDVRYKVTVQHSLGINSKNKFKG
jgi:hypothetical protein